MIIVYEFVTAKDVSILLTSVNHQIHAQKNIVFANNVPIY